MYKFLHVYTFLFILNNCLGVEWLFNVVGICISIHILSCHQITHPLKCSHVLQPISAYELASQEFNYPLHIGITEAGPKDIGLIRSVAGIAPLLLKGIGDTIRISLSDEPEEEIKACKRLLKDLELNNDYPLLISCPTCGRTQVDLVPLANKVLKFLSIIFI